MKGVVQASGAFTRWEFAQDWEICSVLGAAKVFVVKGPCRSCKFWQKINGRRVAVAACLARAGPLHLRHRFQLLFKTLILLAVPKADERVPGHIPKKANHSSGDLSCARFLLWIYRAPTPSACHVRRSTRNSESKALLVLIDM